MGDSCGQVGKAYEDAKLWFRAMYHLAIRKNRAVCITSRILAAALRIAALLGEPGKLAGIFAYTGDLTVPTGYGDGSSSGVAQ
ncbi:MAG: hypothetical protein OSA45_13490 [Halioglobus sp.]|nr:hypothetical protein [Halioglobus sp.]